MHAFFSKFKLHLLLCAFFIALAALIGTQIFTKPTNKTISPSTPSVIPSGPQHTLTILSANPPNQATQVSLLEPIVISFDRKLTAQLVTVTLFPQTRITSEIKEREIILTPQEPYAPGTTYTFVVRYQNSDKIPDTYSFTTTGLAPVSQPDTQPTGASEKEDNFQKVNNPDVFLSNQVPFTTDTFSIESGYASGHFYFSVILKGPSEGAKEVVIKWMKSLGLTEGQIQQLDIRYSNQ